MVGLKTRKDKDFVKVGNWDFWSKYLSDTEMMRLVDELKMGTINFADYLNSNLDEVEGTAEYKLFPFDNSTVQVVFKIGGRNLAINLENIEINKKEGSFNCKVVIYGMTEYPYEPLAMKTVSNEKLTAENVKNIFKDAFEKVVTAMLKRN